MEHKLKLYHVEMDIFSRYIIFLFGPYLAKSAHKLLIEVILYVASTLHDSPFLQIKLDHLCCSQ